MSRNHIIGARKATITKIISCIEQLTKNNIEMNTLDTATCPQGSDESKFFKDLEETGEKNTSTLSQLVQRLENAIDSYATLIDEVSDQLEEQHVENATAQVDNYMQYLVDCQNTAFLWEKNLELLSRNRSYTNKMNIQPTSSLSTTTSPSLHNQPIVVPLTPVLPRFTGKLWEWESFWKMFEETIHNVPVNNIVKFRALLESLNGDAKECVQRFRLSENNYQLAIDLLKSRYDRKDELIICLQSRLEKVVAKSVNYRDQRQLLDNIHSITTQLNDLGQDMDNPFLINQIISKFQFKIQKRLVEYRLKPGNTLSVMKSSLKMIEELINTEELIEKYCPKNEQKIENSKLKSSNPNFGKVTQNSVPRNSFNNNPKHQIECVYCKTKEHKTFECTVCADVASRKKLILQEKICLNCLSDKHKMSDCTSKRTCYYCKQRHHSTICDKASKAETMPQTNKPENNRNGYRQTMNKPWSNPNRTVTAHIAENEDSVVSTKSPATHMFTSVNQVNDRTAHAPTATTCQKALLLIATATTHTREGENIQVDILLDTGSEMSFIDATVAKEWDLPIVGNRSLKLHTFGSDHAKEQLCEIVTLDIVDKFNTMHQLSLLTTPYLTTQLHTADLGRYDLEFLEHKNIRLSFEHKGQMIRPHILLGSDQIWEFLSTDDQNLSLPSGLQLVPSKLGYMITGKISETQNNYESVFQSVSTHMVTSSVLSGDVTLFTSQQETEAWKTFFESECAGVDEYTGTENQALSDLNARILQHFKETAQHKVDGYHVSLPWKDDTSSLPTNRDLSYRRLQAVIRSLQHKPDLLASYDKTFRDQLALGILEEVDETKPPDGPVIHYIAHQAVVSPGKSTPVRVVMDAKARKRDSPSLNDMIHQGPLMMSDIFGIQLRFRTGDIVIVADVEKAFHQVRLHITDRDATRCLWVRDISKPPTGNNILVLRFTRIPFGINASPFLLAAVIEQHRNKVHSKSIISEDLRKNLYVDNVLLLATSDTQGLEKSILAKQFFAEIGMNLRDFMSNSTELLDRLSDTCKASNSNQKILGVQWNSMSDQIVLSCTFPATTKITKRAVSSVLQSVYDPFGLLSPLMTKLKIFAQGLWKKGLQWDEELESDSQTEWIKLLHEVEGFTISLPRQMNITQQRATLVAFSDASESMMATVLYLVYDDKTNIIASKSKLAPLRNPITMPKMELQAITMSTGLIASVLSEITEHVTISEIILYTDSTIALSWITNIADRQGTFVTNRVKEIHKFAQTMNNKSVTVNIGHIPTDINPADCATRGLDKNQIMNHIWWTGIHPSVNISETQPVLRISKDKINSDFENMSEDLHVHVTQIEQNTAASTLVDLNRLSSFNKALRVTSLMRRFIQRMVSVLPQQRRTQITHKLQLEESVGSISALEMKKSLITLLLQHQAKINITETRFQNLLLNTDTDGVIRSYGRLQNSQLPEDTKFPALILPNTRLAELIVEDAHSVLHNSINHTIANVRKSFWIPKLRQLAKRKIGNCVKCQRFNNLPFTHPTQRPLPARAVQRSRPFSNIGVDFFGPLSARTSTDRTTVYGVIFSCCVTRLVHLELVEDMSTISFLNALKRFVGRRGVPTTITSDNAPQFGLANEILQEWLNQEMNAANSEICRFFATHRIEWRQNTPYAPWQGGNFERLIKSIKQSLLKAIGKKYSYC